MNEYMEKVVYLLDTGYVEEELIAWSMISVAHEQARIADAQAAQVEQLKRIADALERLAGCVSEDSADGYPNIFTVNALR